MVLHAAGTSFCAIYTPARKSAPCLCKLSTLPRRLCVQGAESQSMQRHLYRSRAFLHLQGCATLWQSLRARGPHMLVRESTTCKTCAPDSCCFCFSHLKPSISPEGSTKHGHPPTSPYRVWVDSRLLPDEDAEHKTALTSIVEGYRQVCTSASSNSELQGSGAPPQCGGLSVPKPLNRLRERKAHVSFPHPRAFAADTDTSCETCQQQISESTARMQAFEGM